MTWKILEHTSDLFIEATSTSFESTLEELATGMFQNMGSSNISSIDTFNNLDYFDVTATASDRKLLIVELFSNIIAECEGLPFTPIKMSILSSASTANQFELSARVYGIKKQPENIIKGVTFHDLSIIPSNSGKYVIRVLFDI